MKTIVITITILWLLITVTIFSFYYIPNYSNFIHTPLLALTGFFLGYTLGIIKKKKDYFISLNTLYLTIIICLISILLSISSYFIFKENSLILIIIINIIGMGATIILLRKQVKLKNQH